MFLLLCLPQVGDKCLSSGCPLPAMQQPKFYNHILAKSHPNNSRLPFIMPDRTPEDILLSLRPWPTRARTGCRGHSRAVPNHWAWPQRARLGQSTAPPRPPCPKQHLGKHAEDLLVDVVDAAGVHLVLELCPQGRVLLGGEEEGGGVAASGQSGPACRRQTRETDDTGQSRAS